MIYFVIVSSGSSTERARGPGPPEIFFSPSLASNFLERYKVLNTLFTANTCELGRCTRNESDASRLLLFFNLYKTSL